MVGVRDLLKKEATGGCHSVEGYLVILDDKVHLIDSQLDQPWIETPAVGLRVENLKYALMLQLAQMGGGSSIFFHDAIVFGAWIDSQILPYRILSKNTKQDDWGEIDFSYDMIIKGKKKFGHLDRLPSKYFKF